MKKKINPMLSQIRSMDDESLLEFLKYFGNFIDKLNTDLAFDVCSDIFDKEYGEILIEDAIEISLNR